jgi:hypothetical protein
MLEKVAIKNGQSIETDNCITTIIYILSFTVTIFMLQAQLINTEILNDKIEVKKKPCITFKLLFCAVGICFFPIFHYFEFELVILWPKDNITTDNTSCVLQDKKSMYIIRGVKCWLNMRHCRWIIIELLSIR